MEIGNLLHTTPTISHDSVLLEFYVYCDGTGLILRILKQQHQMIQEE